MRTTCIHGSVVTLLLAGCAATPGGTDGASDVAAPAAAATVLQTAYAEPAETAGAALNPAPLEQPSSLESVTEARRLPPAEPTPLTLDQLEAIALENNPTIQQAYARVSALRGKRVQVGLPPNPTAGYSASEIGNDGRGGQQGGYVGQEFVTAHKLALNRAVVSAEVQRAEQELAEAQRRVQTDIRQQYYSTLLAQRRVELTAELARLTGEAVTASRSLLEAQEIPLAGLLQTEVQQQNAQLLATTAHNRLQQAWRELSAVAAGGAMPPQPLEGDITALPEGLNWDYQLSRLQTESPELAAAIAEVERARRALSRARVEPIPNIDTQFTVQYDDGTNYTIAGVQAGVALPLWNRNQGGICQAQAEVTAAVRNVDRVELDLQQRLAVAFRQYADARVTADAYASQMLPRTRQTFELVQTGYRAGEVGYLALLTAQQTYSQTNLAYLDALESLWQSKLQIDGLLLQGSLGTNY